MMLLVIFLFGLLTAYVFFAFHCDFFLLLQLAQMLLNLRKLLIHYLLDETWNTVVKIAHCNPSQKPVWKKVLYVQSVLCGSGLMTVNLHGMHPLRNDNALQNCPEQQEKEMGGRTLRSFGIGGKEK